MRITSIIVHVIVDDEQLLMVTVAKAEVASAVFGDGGRVSFNAISSCFDVNSRRLPNPLALMAVRRRNYM